MMYMNEWWFVVEDVVLGLIDSSSALQHLVFCERQCAFGRAPRE